MKQIPAASTNLRFLMKTQHLDSLSTTISPSKLMTITEIALTTIAPAIGGVVMSIDASGDTASIVGGAVAGAGIAGALAMFLSQAIHEMDIPQLPCAKRLLANWFCGLMTIPFVRSVHHLWFPNEDIVFVAAGMAGAAAMFGVIAMVWWAPPLLRWIKSRGSDLLNEKMQGEPGEKTHSDSDHPK